MSLKLHYINGQWRAFEAPEKPDPGYDAFIAENAHYKKQRERKYKRVLDEAAKNSLPILNEEAIRDVIPPERVKYPNSVIYYDWPGSYEKKTAYEYIDGTKDEGYVLTLPAPVKEEDEGTFGNLKFKVGSILSEQFLKWNDGKFHSPIELNPATHALTEFFSSELSKKDEEIKQLREALKEMIPIAQARYLMLEDTEWEKEKLYKDKIDKAKSLTKP